jgi:hypothetical protein
MTPLVYSSFVSEVSQPNNQQEDDLN